MEMYQDILMNVRHCGPLGGSSSLGSDLLGEPPSQQRTPGHSNLAESMEDQGQRMCIRLDQSIWMLRALHLPEQSSLGVAITHLYSNSSAGSRILQTRLITRGRALQRCSAIYWTFFASLRGVLYRGAAYGAG